MTTMLQVGQSGTARFHDGIWTPPDAPTAKQAATRAGATEGGRVLIGSHPRASGARYEMTVEGDQVSIFETRGGSATSDGIAAEHEKLRAINARNAAFWAKPVPKAKP